jgi:hypothetical protein
MSPHAFNQLADPSLGRIHGISWKWHTWDGGRWRSLILFASYPPFHTHTFFSWSYLLFLILLFLTRTPSLRLLRCRALFLLHVHLGSVTAWFASTCEVYML